MPDIYQKEWSAADVKRSLSMGKHHKLKRFIHTSELMSPIIIITVIIATYFFLNTTIGDCQLDGLACDSTTIEEGMIAIQLQNTNQDQILVEEFIVTSNGQSCYAALRSYIDPGTSKSVAVENCAITDQDLNVQFTYVNAATGAKTITSSVISNVQYKEIITPPPPRELPIVYPEETNESEFELNKETIERLIRPPDPVRPATEITPETPPVYKGCVEQAYCDGSNAMFLYTSCRREVIEECTRGCTQGLCI